MKEFTAVTVLEIEGDPNANGNFFHIYVIFFNQLDTPICEQKLYETLHIYDPLTIGVLNVKKMVEK